MYRVSQGYPVVGPKAARSQLQLKPTWKTTMTHFEALWKVPGAAGSLQKTLGALWQQGTLWQARAGPPEAEGVKLQVDACWRQNGDVGCGPA